MDRLECETLVIAILAHEGFSAWQPMLQPAYTKQKHIV